MAIADYLTELLTAAKETEVRTSRCTLKPQVGHISPVPNRAILTQAALRHRLGQLAAQFPDTGSLRQDVLTVLRSYRG